MPSPVGLVELPTTTSADRSIGEDETDPGVVAARPPTAAAVTNATALSTADGSTRPDRCFPIAFPSVCTVLLSKATPELVAK